MFFPAMLSLINSFMMTDDDDDNDGDVDDDDSYYYYYLYFHYNHNYNRIIKSDWGKLTIPDFSPDSTV